MAIVESNYLCPAFKFAISNATSKAYGHACEEPIAVDPQEYSGWLVANKVGVGREQCLACPAVAAVTLEADECEIRDKHTGQKLFNLAKAKKTVESINYDECDAE